MTSEGHYAGTQPAEATSGGPTSDGFPPDTDGQRVSGRASAQPPADGFPNSYGPPPERTPNGGSPFVVPAVPTFGQGPEARAAKPAGTSYGSARVPRPDDNDGVPQRRSASPYGTVSPESASPYGPASSAANGPASSAPHGPASSAANGNGSATPPGRPADGSAPASPFGQPGSAAVPSYGRPPGDSASPFGPPSGSPATGSASPFGPPSGSPATGSASPFGPSANGAAAGRPASGEPSSAWGPPPAPPARLVDTPSPLAAPGDPLPQRNPSTVDPGGSIEGFDGFAAGAPGRGTAADRPSARDDVDPATGRPPGVSAFGAQRVRVPGATLTGLPDGPAPAQPTGPSDNGGFPRRIENTPDRPAEGGGFPQRSGNGESFPPRGADSFPPRGADSFPLAAQTASPVAAQTASPVAARTAPPTEAASRCAPAVTAHS